MSDYYNLPPPERKKRWTLDRLAMLLFLLFLIAIAMTVCSLRDVPESTLVSTIPPEPPAAPVQISAAPVEEPEPEPVIPEETDIPEPEEAEPDLEPEAEPVAEEEPEPPPALFRDARWRETAEFPGTDAAGRSATFTAYVLTSEQTWTFARADELFSEGLGEPVETAFAALDLGPGVCSLTRVIAVGAASVEGTPERNTWLSRARGEALRTAIEANLPCEDSPVPGRVLDLGYAKTRVACPGGERLCPELTAPQRPVAMILIRADDPETDIGAALRNGITLYERAGGTVLPEVSLMDYSGFETAFNRL